MTVRFNSLTDTLPKPCGSDWQSHLAMLGVHVERSNKSSGSLWSPAVYAEGERRGNAGVIGMTCFVADLDGESLDDALERLNEFTYLAYTTYSHADGDEHWHVVVPFRREVGVGSWGAVWEWCHELLGLDGDEATKDCARIYFTPQHAPHSMFDYQCNIGELLEPPTTLAWNAPQRTRSRTNPTRNRVVEMDDAWWDAGKPMSQFAHLEGAELWKALRDEFVRLRAEAGI